VKSGEGYGKKLVSFKEIRGSKVVKRRHKRDKKGGKKGDERGVSGISGEKKGNKY